MRRYRSSLAIAAAALALCVFVAGTTAVLGIPPLALPSPTDVVKLIDMLTKKDSSTTVDVQMASTASQGKLLVARSRVDIHMERSSRNWRGRVMVQMKVPTDISYTVDLGKIKAEHIRLDARQRALIVTMPPLEVEDVTPLLANARSDNTYKAARFRLFDSNTSRELQNAILMHDYQARARQVGQENAARLREQGRQALQAFLQRLLQNARPGVTVIVE